MEKLAFAVLLAAFLGGVVLLNLANHRRRARMTAGERAAEDEDIQRELAIW